MTTTKKEPRIPLGTGIENTAIKRAGCKTIDTYTSMGHETRYEEDLSWMQKLCIDVLRYSISWNRVEQTCGVYDWSWLDKVMNCIKELGITLMADPLHHSSYPDWLIDGFADDRFEESYFQFVVAFSKRYPWVKKYAIVNEPYVTIDFCGLAGKWPPHGINDEPLFIKMIISTCRAISRVTQYLLNTISDVEITHIDTCQKHTTTDESFRDQVTHRNMLKFLPADLVLGHVHEQHPLYEWLLAGTSKESLAWFVQNPSIIHVMGLDYYAHSEVFYGTTKVSPAGFAAVAFEYYDRYKLPVRLTETNLRGTITDRITWWRHMLSQCSKLMRKLPKRYLRGADWYPGLNSTDWDSLVCVPNGNIDPQGIIEVDKDLVRLWNEFAGYYRQLALGNITWRQLPSYELGDGVKDTHRAYKNKFMRSWKWKKVA